MRDSVAALGLLTAALLACGFQPTGTFTAKSARADNSQICDEAIEIGDDDVEFVSGAGGKMIGVYEGDPTSMPVAHDVAYYGGTHFLMRGSNTSHESMGLIGRTHKDARYDVFRVPVSQWSVLRGPLKPKAN